MAQPKNMRVEVSMPFEKLMEFMDYMDRISAHVETIEKDSETTKPVQECATACVCNDTFGMLAAKRNFHAYIQNLSPNLVKHLEDFLEFAESENFAPFDRELAENEEIIATQVAIPTFLADVFEAVAGAVITDSNLSFETLEKVFVPFMNSVYDTPPISPFNQLEKTPGISFQKGKARPDGRPTFSVYQNGVLLATGIDENRKNAKFAASKYAAWKIEMGLN
ncbi:hypothetical protein DAPPUDRAFT_114306 [Daphnia pulex]|uniref:RNase III domain-containing protein n=1 Tax=Daphnia pulex TaxID=6669 RepID=E9HHR3_DAPPU|nr:hypothetical protein DAPPUDRAFT_114306 [Daphnia pulex]|eukprot:EFX68719.1 hypothetical protein DAPPUDRAFT_114306 [Daphnia pulex]